ncbi:MAG: hypothetical protein F6K41_19760 [Symploca sp. SIO3E6]|nr:hypothetical protein [Caldora sp. SIO3E6]
MKFFHRDCLEASCLGVSYHLPPTTCLQITSCLLLLESNNKQPITNNQ